MESIFSLFYFPNLAFALFFPFFQILVYSKAIRLKFNFSNPLLISCLFSFPFLLFTVVLGPYEILTEFYSNSIFHFALGMDNLYAFCRFTSVLFLFALLQKLKKRVGELPISKVKKISKTRLRKIGFLFLTTSLILIIFIARLANKDFFDLIRDPRDVYQNHRFGVGYLYALSTSYFLPFGMAFFLCTKPKKLPPTSTKKKKM